MKALVWMSAGMGSRSLPSIFRACWQLMTRLLPLEMVWRSACAGEVVNTNNNIIAGKLIVCFSICITWLTDLTIRHRPDICASSYGKKRKYLLFLEDLFPFFSRDCFAKQKSLVRSATTVFQKFKLHLVFDTFGDHLDLK